MKPFDDVTMREAVAADAPFLLALAREAYREVLSLQFAGWDEAVHGGARSLGLPVRLYTLRLNRAIVFYERHGFVVTARRDEYIDFERAG